MAVNCLNLDLYNKENKNKRIRIMKKRKKRNNKKYLKIIKKE